MKAGFLMSVAIMFSMSAVSQAQSGFGGRWATEPPAAGRGNSGPGPFASAPVFTSQPAYTNPPATGTGGTPAGVPGVPDAALRAIPAGNAPGALFGGTRGGATGTLGGPSPVAPETTSGGRGNARTADIRLNLRVEGSRLTGTISADGVDRAVDSGVVSGKQVRFRTSRGNNSAVNNPSMLNSDVNWTGELINDNTLVLRYEITGGGRGTASGSGRGGGANNAPAPVTLRRVR